jgi:hypothetical protein
VIVSLRLLTNTPLGKGRLSEPSADGSRVYRSGEERRWRERRGDMILDVLERKLSLFAEQSGSLSIDAAIYSGYLEDPSARQILRRSQPLSLQVRELPAGSAERPWLPAEAVEWQLSWDDHANRFSIGESVGLDLTLVARGLPAERLPVNLLSQTHPEFRIYADEARLSNRFEGASIVGRLQQSFVFVASRPGIIDVPGTMLNWWDTGANRWREARLPGQRLNILEPVSSAGFAEPGTMQALTPRGSAQAWPWLPGVIVVGLLFGFGFRSKPGRRLRASLAGLRERRAIEKSLQAACRLNDPEGARAALQKWATTRWPTETIYGLRAIGDRLGDAELGIELAKLDAVLYTRHPAPWRGESLWRQFCASVRGLASIEPARTSVLPRLYPDQSRDSSRAQPLTGSKRSP